MLDQVLALFGLGPDHDLDLMRPCQNLHELTGRVISALRPVNPSSIQSSQRNMLCKLSAGQPGKPSSSCDAPTGSGVRAAFMIMASSE